MIREYEAQPPAAARPARNPGPGGAIRLMRLLDRILPEVVYRPIRMAAAWVTLAILPVQRRHSRDYLRAVLAREPSLREVFNHFFAFGESLMLRLRVVNGRNHSCRLARPDGGFGRWMEEGFPVLLGTFHVGVSDLLGFLLGGKEKRLTHLVRLRVGNSHDTDGLLERCGDWVKIVWVNEPEEMLFALKEAAGAPGAIALQCDRVEFSAKTEPFEFLGARRLFPVTIYHLARMFQRPVVLSVGIREGEDWSVLYDSPVFHPVDGESREAALARGREHFQAYLRRLEDLLRANPYAWFNFTPLNPVVESAPKEGL